MKKIIILSILFLWIYPAMNAQIPSFQNLSHCINSDSLSKTIQDMQNFGSRYCNDSEEGNRTVAQYLVQRLKSYGIENAAIDSFYLSLNNGWLPPISRYCYNVKATIAGSQPNDTTVIIGAHLDAISLDNWILQAEAPGADDNASGIAIMMELARIFATGNFQPKYSISFVGFDAEEVGLKGSGHDVDQRYQNQETILAILNNDMVANQPEDEPYTLNIHWYDNALNLLSRADTFCKSFTTITPYTPNNEENEMNQYSDSYTYFQYGYRPIFFIEHTFSSHYHTPTDLLEYCNIDFLTQVTLLNMGMLYDLTIYDIFAEHPNLIPETASTLNSDAISVFPNPSSEYITLRASTQQNIEIYQIDLYDITGRMVMTEFINSNFTKLNISDLRSGIYLLNVLTSQGIIQKKIIKK